MLHSRQVPSPVRDAASQTWSRWGGRLAGLDQPRVTAKALTRGAPRREISPEERMIAKIKKRMKEYPEWYETNPKRLSETVCRKLGDICARLERELPWSFGAVEVWTIPLSVFNWLVYDPERGEIFVRGALCAWSSAECFNDANNPDLSAAERQTMRAHFFEIAPPLLTAVLEKMLEHGLRITFAQSHTNAEFTALVMRVKQAVD